MGNSAGTEIINSAGGKATSIFQFDVEKIDGEKVSLSSFQGKKAYIVVNVASQCGLTNQNYAELEELYKKHGPSGLEILAFPCNNFGKQEPGSNAEILEFAKKKGATFPVLGKLECESGESTHPLYQYLRGSLDNGLLGPSLKWNFTKFLCDAQGVPVKRYAPVQSPLSFENDIIALLENGKL